MVSMVPVLGKRPEYIRTEIYVIVYFPETISPMRYYVQKFLFCTEISFGDKPNYICFLGEASLF